MEDKAERLYNMNLDDVMTLPCSHGNKIRKITALISRSMTENIITPGKNLFEGGVIVERP